MLRKLFVFFFGIACFAGAQTTNPDPALRPPAGARVAVIEFADLECPRCGKENPGLRDATARHHVAWVRHDFPLSMHVWSFQAAVNARWFDTKSKKMGDDYRDAVFANQNTIESLDGLRTYTEKFAKEHGVALPFALDPQNKLSELVKADYTLGMRLGVHATPTLWIVTSRPGGNPQLVDLRDMAHLDRMLDAAATSAGGK
jgi:protein-disulfide isomerase